MESDDDTFKSDCDDAETSSEVHSQQNFACPNCGNVGPLELIDESRERVCSNCGIVFEGSLAGEEVWAGGKQYMNEDNSSIGVTLYNMNGRDFTLKGYDKRRYLLNARNECIRRIKDFSYHFKLTTVQAERAKIFFLSLVDLKLTPFSGKKGNLYMAACIYIVVRQEGLGIGLLEIAARIDSTIWKVGKAYKKAKSCLRLYIDDIDPFLFLERIIKNSFERLVFGRNECQKYIHDAAIIKSLPISPHKLSGTASKLIGVAADAFLGTGRKPEAIAAAAVVLAMEAHIVENELPVPPCWHKAPTTKMLVEALGEATHIPDSTIRLRHREISRVICSHAENLPWVQKSVSLQKARMYVLDVLSFWGQLKKDDPLLKVLERKEGEDEEEEEEEKGEKYQSRNPVEDCMGSEISHVPFSNDLQPNLEIQQQTIPINHIQPPSFRRAYTFACNREAKLSLAKERVKLNLLHSLDQSILNLEQNVDEEVLVLEKLFMHNFQDSELLHLPFGKLREMAQRQTGIKFVEGGTIAASECNWDPRGIIVSSRRSDELDDKEIDHRDMSENEYNMYMRPMAEVKAKEAFLEAFAGKDHGETVRERDNMIKKESRRFRSKEHAKVSGLQVIESSTDKKSLKGGRVRGGNHRSKRVKISKHVEDMTEEEFD